MNISLDWNLNRSVPHKVTEVVNSLEEMYSYKDISIEITIKSLGFVESGANIEIDMYNLGSGSHHFNFNLELGLIPGFIVGVVTSNLE